MADIKCLYSCRQCGLEKIPVPVPERTEKEEVTDWVKAAANLMGRDHLFRSSGCQSGRLDIMIPAPAGTSRVGEVVRS